MEYKMGMRDSSFSLVWDIFGEMQSLKEGKKDKFTANEKYGHQNTL